MRRNSEYNQFSQRVTLCILNVSIRSETILCIHCNENSIYVFLFWELCGLSPNFHIHLSVSDLYIPRIGSHTVYSCGRLGRLILEIYKSLTGI
jgi:hypothetical protein